MISMTVAEARADFANVLKRAQNGEKITITHGRKREPIVMIVPFDTSDIEPRKKREFGKLAHWVIEWDTSPITYEDLFPAKKLYEMDNEEE